MFTPNELKSPTLDFSREHATDSDEKSLAQTFWRDFHNMFPRHNVAITQVQIWNNMNLELCKTGGPNG